MEFATLSPEERYEAIQEKYVRFTPPTPPTTPELISPQDIAGNILKIDIPAPEPVEIVEIVETDKNVIVCICGGKYSYFNKNRHYNTKKHQNAILSLQDQLPLSSPLLLREEQVNSSP
jgi:hypothetical protein